MMDVLIRDRKGENTQRHGVERAGEDSYEDRQGLERGSLRPRNACSHQKPEARKDSSKSLQREYGWPY